MYIICVGISTKLCRLETITHHRYIFWFLVDCCITNAYILARECQPAGSGRSKDMKAFRIQLA